MTASVLKMVAVAVGVAAGIALAPRHGAALSNPNDFCTGDPCQITSNKTADADITLNFGTRAVVLSAILTVGKRPGTNRPGNLTIVAGSFSIIGTGQIDGAGVQDPGGSVTIQCTGDIRIDGTRTTGAVRLSGTDGGQLSLFTDGNVYGAGRINLSQASTFAAGGDLQISAGGDVTITGKIDAEGNSQGFGGTVDVSAAQSIALTGGIDISGGQGGGGGLDVYTDGSITLGAVDFDGGGDAGDGGFVSVVAVGTVSINGGMVGHGANNGENCGDAGELDLFADGGIFVNAPIEMRGRGLDCFGGYLTADGDTLQTVAVIDVSATGTEGFGGDIDIYTSSTMTIAAALRTDGADGAGDVLLGSDGNISLGGSIRADGRGTFGTGASVVDIDSGGVLAVSGSINAIGGGQGAGGDVSLSGCTVLQTSGSTIDTRSTGGLIGVTGNDSITLQGSFLGEPTTPQAIVIRYRLGSPPPSISSATFNVPPTVIANSLIQPCALCMSNDECSDGNPCTNDVCTPATGCSNPANLDPCDDGNACTANDFCAFSLCLSLTPVVCDDGNVCTDDSCDPELGCQAALNTAPCSDGDLCTQDDTCSGGLCTGTAIDCSDGNACTDDLCVAGVCQSNDNTAPCDDGDACTTPDLCGGGACQSGPAAVCEDGDLCTIDSCDPGLGCVNEPVPVCSESDADGDGVPDVEDVCTTLDWTSTPQSPPNQHPFKMKLNIKNLTKPRGEQGILLKGAFNVADADVPVSPHEDGIHFSVADAAGTLYEVDVPGGAVGAPQNCGPLDGWTTRLGTKSRWKYANRSGALPPSCTPGSAHGVAVVQIKDARATGKSALLAKVTIKKAAVDRIPSLPLTHIQADLVLAAQPAPGQASAAAIAGHCAEGLITGAPIPASSPAPFCKQKLRNGALEKVTCQGG
jgi:hypothetical protein